MSPADGREPMLSTSEPDRYTPVSGLAVAALLVSIFSAILIVGIAVAARASGKPAYQPLVLVPAVFGFVLAIMARWAVKHSQGARTGLGFTTAALWLSGLGAACFAAYMITTELAVRGQARAFTEQWFQKIANESLEAAFLLTLDPGMRYDIDPQNVSGIQSRFGVGIYAFRDNEVVRYVRRAGSEIEIEPRGVQTWDYVSEGYFIEQNFAIRCREGEYTCVVAVLGQDRPALGGRVWKILVHRTEIKERKTTEFGRLMIDALFENIRFVRNWVEKLNEGKTFAAYLETLPPADRITLKDQTDSPGFQQFLKGSLIRVDGKEPSEADRAIYAAALKQYQGINTSPGSIQSQVGPPNPEFVGDRLRLTQMVEIHPPDGKTAVAYIVTELYGEQVQAAFNKLRAGDWRQLPILPPAPKSDSQLAIDRYPDRGFRVVSIDVQPRAARLPQPQPMQPN